MKIRIEETKKRTGVRFITVLSVIGMLLVTGCSAQDGPGAMKQGSGDQREQQTVKGRYVETEMELPVEVEDVLGMYKVSDDRLLIIDRQGKMLVSEDNGGTWQENSRQWLQERASDAYILDAKVDSKGVMGIIYAENEKEESNISESVLQPSLQCVLLLPDETVIPVQFSQTGKEECIDRFWISPTDQYFVSTMEGTIYAVREDGTASVYLMTQGSPQLMQFQENLMIIDGYDFKEPLLYDREKEEYVEDEVLAAFVKENYGERGFNGSGWHNLCIFPGEEGVIYLAGKHGLHRHVMGGAVMEQVIDARLSRLGNPQYGIAGMVFLETGEFLAVSAQGKLIKFSYDPDKEAVPQEKLKIYSLEKDSDIYTAISFYQIQNPDVLVEYEVGMEEGDVIGREDAVKKLNTQIMAGNGPDILVLDDLPMESYIEKGILCNLQDLVEELDEDVFANLIRVWEREDGIYGIPGQVMFPVILGKEGEISGMTDLAAVADGMERMREDVPGQDLIGLYSEKAIMKILAVVSSQTWKKGEQINRDAMADFLTQSKRIYEAQVNGLEEESLDRILQSEENYVQSAGENWVYDLMNYGFYMDYVAGNSRTFLGMSSSPRSYMELASVSKAEGLEDTVLMPMEGGQGKVFIPQTTLGIVETAQKKELAQDFVKTFLGKEIQGSLSGYAVNRAAFEEAFAVNEEEIGEQGEYGQVGIVDEDGQELLMTVYAPKEEEITVIREWMETAKMSYAEDTVLETCVLEEGSLYLLGERGIEETLDAVERRLAIYMAE